MTDIIFELQDKLTIVAILYARIAPIFMILPVLNNSVLANNFIRNSIIVAVIIGLWPAIDKTLPIPVSQLGIFESCMLMFKEVIVGSTIAFVLAMPFWIFNAVGSFIDVGRGASMGTMADPTSGQESTEIQNFINFCVCAVYLQIGGIKIILESLLLSYKNIGIQQGVNFNLDMLTSFLAEVFAEGFVLASPVLLTLFLSEVLLGLLSRFTPQLSAFSVSMTIKSTIAIFILSLYFWQIMPDHLLQYVDDYAGWNLLHGVNLK
jgi:type III secretion protein SpaR/YscT/HrcT